MLTKVCTKCGRELPANGEYFYKNKQGKYGLLSVCKDCDRQYRKENKQRILEYTKRYNEANRERINKVNRQRIKQYRETNKQKASEEAKQYRETNRERIKQYKKSYNKLNKDKKNKYNLEYNKLHPDKKAGQNQRRRALKKQVTASLTDAQWEEIKQKFNNTCAYCGKKARLEQEHFIALSSSGEYTINNIIPACKSCNSSKNNKDFFEWYPKQKFYSKKRENKILKVLNYKNKTEQQLSII